MTDAALDAGHSRCRVVEVSRTANRRGPVDLQAAHGGSSRETPGPNGAQPDPASRLALVNVAEFVAKWKGSTRSERAASQEHFIDLCNLLEAVGK